MQRHAILTAIGADRVGIVDDLTAVILEEKCNIEESRMAVLGGEFAVILLLSGEEEQVRQLLDRLPGRGQELGLHVSLKETVPPRTDPHSRPYRIETISLDTPGIVHGITSLLLKYRINIEDLETDTTAAPWTGAPMFLMRARIAVPTSVPISRLREDLEALEAQSNLDVKLVPISIDQSDA